MSQTPIQLDEILNRAKALQGTVRDWRRTIHQNPELSFNEIQNGTISYQRLK